MTQKGQLGAETFCTLSGFGVGYATFGVSYANCLRQWRRIRQRQSAYADLCCPTPPDALSLRQ